MNGDREGPSAQVTVPGCTGARKCQIMRVRRRVSAHGERYNPFEDAPIRP